MLYKHRGKYFEELNVGDEFYTPAKTITETDVVTFAQVSGDWNPLHIDDEYAKTTHFRQRPAHNLLCVSLASGFTSMLGIFEGTVTAFTNISWSFYKGVVIGDTISAKIVITDKRETEHRGSGHVTVDTLIYNQHDELVSEGKKEYLIRRKP